MHIPWATLRLELDVLSHFAADLITVICACFCADHLNGIIILATTIITGLHIS